jgi:hypothetical protein
VDHPRHTTGADSNLRFQNRNADVRVAEQIFIESRRAFLATTCDLTAITGAPANSSSSFRRSRPLAQRANKGTTWVEDKDQRGQHEDELSSPRLRMGACRPDATN